MEEVKWNPLEKETATLHPKRYTISLEVKEQDGHRIGYIMRTAPIGFSNTDLAWYLTQLLLNFDNYLNTAQVAALDSSRNTPPDGPKS